MNFNKVMKSLSKQDLLSNIWISIDLEMNNDPELKDADDDTDDDSLDTQPIQHKKLVISDVIQIGACAFDIRTGEIVDKTRIYIKLPSDKKLHPKIVKLTGITENDLNNHGRSPYLAYKELEDFVKRNKAFRDPISWGGNDAKYLHEDLKKRCSFDEKFIFGSLYFEVKKLYQVYRMLHGQGSRSGLGKSMTKLGLKFVGRRHDALDDAINTATLFCYLISKLQNQENK